MDVHMLEQKAPVIRSIKAGCEVSWMNPELEPAAEALGRLKLGMKEVLDAEKRLERFAPFIRKAFPETEQDEGIIESPLCEIPSMKERLNQKEGAAISGRLFLKMDSELAVAGSVKARGGIYEILKHAEELALEAGLLEKGMDYGILSEQRCRRFFSDYRVHVGSTGNLGLSIGIISAALGFEVCVHMSRDAKQWKKDLLRSKGVQVKEYRGDYGEAVKKGREEARKDPHGYFVDDENSENLFLGYSVAALRLKRQLEQKNIRPDAAHPLFVYLPCGVGGAPGGINFGLKLVYQDAVHVFYVEPVQACCMLLGIVSGLHNGICVQDIGLTGMTQADGLAVGRPSQFVGKTIRHLVDGIFTLKDEKLYRYMKALTDSQNLFIEPSACAAFEGAVRMETDQICRRYLRESGLSERMDQAVHIVWATGGSLVPEKIRQEYMQQCRE